MHRRTLLLATTMLAPAAALAQSALGLAERRALAGYRETIFPGLLRDIQAAAGFELPVEVEWDTLAVPGRADRYNEPGFFTDIYFRPLINALRQIGRDDMGRQALRAGLRRVTVAYDRATAPATNYRNGLRFEGGTLRINWTPFENANDVADRTEALVTTLERGL